MNYFNLKFRVNFLGHVKNVKINILFFTVYTYRYLKRFYQSYINIQVRTNFTERENHQIEEILTM